MLNVLFNSNKSSPFGGVWNITVKKIENFIGSIGDVDEL